MNDTTTATVAPTVTPKKVWTKEEIKLKLGTDPRWAIRGLVRIYEYQTSQEQSSEHTIESNGVGFNGTDGTILTSFAKFYLKYNRLSDKQMVYVFKKMPKYAGQLLRLISEVKS